MSQLDPFLKWAGGKRWLVRDYSDFFPRQYGRYIEPFLGGGAVFFALNPRDGVLGDLNAQLIDCYSSVRDAWQDVLMQLKRHQKLHSRDHYYQVRASKPRTPCSHAARFIYLNRACWNGLYRVNLKGEFNVPKGTKDKVLLPEDDFEEVASRLSDFELVCGDFEKIIDRAGEDDLIFADPPYTVRHNHNSFIKYNEKLFSWDDQCRLFEALKRAAARGAKVVATNAGHGCIRELYGDDFDLWEVSRNSSISSKPTERGQYEEYVITANT